MKPLLIFLFFSFQICKGQFALLDSTYGIQNKNDTSNNIWHFAASLGVLQSQQKQWDFIKRSLNDTWYYAYDSTQKTIWKWRYMSDTLYITNKIKKIIYLK